jgi:hypothetical protein
MGYPPEGMASEILGIHAPDLMVNVLLVVTRLLHDAVYPFHWPPVFSLSCMWP